MRLGAMVVLAAVAAGAGDDLVQAKAQGALASAIQQQLPGTRAVVHIGPYPAVAYLAVTGRIPELTIQVLGASGGDMNVDGLDVPLDFDVLTLRVHDVSLQRSALLHGRVVVNSIGSSTVTGEISAASLSRDTGLPVTIADGEVGIGGLAVPAAVHINRSTVVLQVGRLIRLTVQVPSLSQFPCAGSVQVVRDSILLACTLEGVPVGILHTNLAL
jgi:hypothetical protein